MTPQMPPDAHPNDFAETGMCLCVLRRDIRKRLATGESRQSIADNYGIKSGMVWQIEHGYKPGKKVSAILQLAPDSSLRYTQRRRAMLNKIAQELGFPTWCALESEVISKWK